MADRICGVLICSGVQGSSTSAKNNVDCTLMRHRTETPLIVNTITIRLTITTIQNQ